MSDEYYVEKRKSEKEFIFGGKPEWRQTRCTVTIFDSLDE